MTPQMTKQAAELLRDLAKALRGVEKVACEQKQVPDGPVINIAKLRSLLNGNG